MNTRTFVLISLVTLALAGCGGGLDLEDAQVFTLVQVDGVPVPAEVVEAGGTTRVFVADTIWLRPDDTWRRHKVQTRIELDGTSTEVGYISDGFITIRGGALVLDFECNDVLIRSPAMSNVCVAPDELMQTEDGWVIEREHFAGVRLLSYQGQRSN